MEISNSLLVVLMFVGILTLGIVGLLSALSSVVNHRGGLKADALHTSWIVLMLLSHLQIFWGVLDILAVEEWTYVTFLYMLSGPIILFFCSNILMPNPGDPDADDGRRFYYAIAPQFFLLLAILQIWFMGVDLLLGYGVNRMTVVGVIALVIAVTLSRAKSPSVHTVGTLAAWLLFVGAMVVRGAGML